MVILLSENACFKHNLKPLLLLFVGNMSDVYYHIYICSSIVQHLTCKTVAAKERFGLKNII